MCGMFVTNGPRGFFWSIHHRADRGMGGSKAPWMNLPSNLVVLCGSGTTGCHGFVTNHKRDAVAEGFSVLRGILLPSQVPILHQLYGRVLLKDDGDYEEYAEG
jgi:hypothetical protein